MYGELFGDFQISRPCAIAIMLNRLNLIELIKVLIKSTHKDYFGFEGFRNYIDDLLIRATRPMYDSKKLSLKALTVSSFITNISDEKNQIIGGANQHSHEYDTCSCTINTKLVPNTKSECG